MYMQHNTSHIINRLNKDVINVNFGKRKCKPPFMAIRRMSNYMIESYKAFNNNKLYKIKWDY